MRGNSLVLLPMPAEELPGHREDVITLDSFRFAGRVSVRAPSSRARRNSAYERSVRAQRRDRVDRGGATRR